jgi:hypothetical protein
VRARSCILAIAAGCSFRHGVVLGDGAVAPDVSDAPIPRPDGQGACAWSYAPSNFDPCSLPPGVPLTVANGNTYTIDTGGTSLPHTPSTMQSNNVPIIVVHLTSLDVQGTLATSGDAALVIAVDGMVQVEANAIVTAGTSVNNPFACATAAGSTGHPGGAGVGGGGGGGGAGASDGGDGGDGDGTGGGAHGPHGTHATSNLVPLRGGCIGGSGGTSNGNGTPGGSGAGGGVLQISSNTSVEIAGEIDASGGGGAGNASAQTGGGGGGGGGAIFLEGPTIQLDLNSVLCADGGSGSQGGGQSASNGPGSRSPCNGTAGAVASNSGNNGGRGGNGGFRVTPTGGTGSKGNGGSNAGGGGGGGGVGWIRLRAIAVQTIDPNAVVTPTQQ